MFNGDKKLAFVIEDESLAKNIKCEKGHDCEYFQDGNHP
jgi:hypothetical protein